MIHLSGLDIDVMMGTKQINIKNYSLSIEDGSKAATTRGVPHGYVRGTVKATGEITLDTENFLLVIEEAKSAGSWQQLEPFDIIGNGETPDQTLEVAAYGCLLTLSKVLDADSESDGKLEHTIPYEVTDSRFVTLNGVPYLDPARVEKLGF